MKHDYQSKGMAYGITVALLICMFFGFDKLIFVLPIGILIGKVAGHEMDRVLKAEKDKHPEENSE